jgi:uncharacterized coiled-coil DUF342 family protein
MGLGSTAKKLQRVADVAEELYKRMNEVRDQVVETQETVSETRQRTERLERELAEQRVVLEALAEKEGLDVEALTADVHIDEAETDVGAETTDETDETDASDATGDAQSES